DPAPGLQANSELNAVYSSSPSIGAHGLVSEKMGWEQYMIRVDGRDLAFEGDAFHPGQPIAGSGLYFELVDRAASRICRYAILTRGLTVLAGAAAGQHDPAISPDERHLVFVSGSGLQLLDGTRLASGTISGPSFFPDGARVAFTEGLPGHQTIQVVSLGGGAPQTLVSRGDCMQPAVSPDGRLLAFSCTETGARQIWVLDLHSGDSRRLTAGRCSNTSPTWDRESRSLVFASDCGRGLGLPALYRLPLDAIPGR